LKIIRSFGLGIRDQLLPFEHGAEDDADDHKNNGKLNKGKSLVTFKSCGK